VTFASILGNDGSLECRFGPLAPGTHISKLIKFRSTERQFFAEIEAIAWADNAAATTDGIDFEIEPEDGSVRIDLYLDLLGKANDPVDVYLDDVRVADDLDEGQSTGFSEFEITTINPTLYIVDGSSTDGSAPLDSFSVDLLIETESDTAISTKTDYTLLRAGDGSFQLVALFNSRPEAVDSTQVDVAAVHIATDTDESLTAQFRPVGGNVLADVGSIAFGERSDYVELAPGRYEVVLESGGMTEAFFLDLADLAGEAVFVKVLSATDGFSVVMVDGSGNVSEAPVATGIERDASIPAAFRLHDNYPNPFNPETTIRFDLPESMDVRLAIYDVAGRVVETLVDGRIGAGQYTVRWDAGNVSSGLYLYRIEAGDTHRATKTMVLMK
jgi:hypothetical protein